MNCFDLQYLQLWRRMPKGPQFYHNWSYPMRGWWSLQILCHLLLWQLGLGPNYHTSNGKLAKRSRRQIPSLGVWILCLKFIWDSIKVYLNLWGWNRRQAEVVGLAEQAELVVSSRTSWGLSLAHHRKHSLLRLWLTSQIFSEFLVLLNESFQLSIFGAAQAIEWSGIADSWARWHSGLWAPKCRLPLPPLCLPFWGRLCLYSIKRRQTYAPCARREWFSFGESRIKILWAPSLQFNCLEAG